MQNFSKLKFLWPFSLNPDGTSNVQIDEVGMTCRVTADSIPFPSAPSNLSANPLGNGIALNWDDNPISENVTSYHVYRSTNEGGPYTSLSSPTTSDYTDTSASANTTYWYHIIAVNAGGNSPYSAISGEYVTDTTPPGVPSILSTTQTGATSVTITWTNPTDSDFAGCNVYRSTTSGGTYTKINTNGLITVPSFTDPNATVQHWYYKVTSVDQTGNESSAATTDLDVTDTLAPAAPTGVSALDIHSAIRITWNANTEPDLASYSIYRSDDSYTTAIATGLAAATYDDTSATIGAPYTYKVVAVDTSANASSKSSASNSATRTSASASTSLSAFANTGGLMAPCAVHIRGVNYTQYRITEPTSPPAVVTFTQNNDFNPQLSNSDEIHARYEWNMCAGANNPQGSYPTGRGFNFAHVYDSPGSYLATLDRTDPTGHKDSFSLNFTVSPNTRKRIYCSSNGDGSSSNPGTNQSSPVNLTRAAAILQGSSQIEVWLRRGDTFNVSSAPVFVLSKNQQRITSDPSFSTSSSTINTYPIIRPTTIPSAWRYFIQVTSSSQNAVIENLQFSRGYTGKNSQYLYDVGIQVIGSGNTLVRNIVFNDIGKPLDGDNGGRTTRYLLVQDCACPTISSMQYNFLFATGADMCFFGIFIADSVGEHGFRLSEVDRVNIMKCNITIGAFNGKNPINAQQGSFWYFSRNTLKTDWPTSPLAGDVQLGPLNKTTATLEAYCTTMVLEENVCTTFVQVEDGAKYVMIRNNILGQPEGFAIQIYGHGEGVDQYGRALNTRVNQYVYIYNNTCINTGKGGQLLSLKYSMSNLEFSNNLCIFPNGVIASSSAGANEALWLAGIGSNNVFSRNIIPFAFDRIYKNGSQYATAQFNQNGGSNNALDAVTIDGNYKPTFTKGQGALGRPIPGVFSSINGKDRGPNDISSTPGAYAL